MKTSTVIEYGAVDVTAKADSQLSVNNTQTFSKLNELKLPEIRERKYSTLEKNHFVLDGECENMGNTISDVGWWSADMSDEFGGFNNPPVMTINFSQVHTSLGLTLTFSEYAYCNNLKIQYYDVNDALISENIYYPDKHEYFCDNTTENYKKIVITFYSTNVPYRYLKLYKIVYGQDVIFTGENLISANLLEQVNLLSDELSINTLDFTVYSDDDKFNILNPQGVYTTLQQRQRLDVYEIKNDTTQNMGTFYIDSWQSKNDNQMEFSGIDLVGLLDKTEFDGGMYTNITTENLIGQIFTSAGFSSSDYSIQDELKSITLTGYIARCTHREALQQVLFTIGAVANCARTDIVEIYAVEESAEPIDIPRGNVFQGTKEIELGEIVTGVLLQAHNYRQGNSPATVYEGTLTAGTHKIAFGTPVSNISATGAMIQSSGANHAIVNVATTADVVVSGYEYIDNTQDVFVPNNHLVAEEKSNVLKIDGVYLINNSNAQAIGQRIIDYYNGRFITKFNFILDEEKVTDNVVIDENYGNTLNGYITELDIDLTGGYVVKSEVVAKVGASE